MLKLKGFPKERLRYLTINNSIVTICLKEILSTYNRETIPYIKISPYWLIVHPLYLN